MIKAKRTEYKGIVFRSRLEVRWATFLDFQSIPWEYEPRLIDLGVLRYLPDFWLPSHRAWLEIKGEIINDEVGLTIVRKCELLARSSDAPVILAFYDPMAAKCAAFFPTGEMYGDAHFGMCPLCGYLAVLIRDGAERFAFCPHPNPALTIQAERTHRRIIFDAATAARSL